jgi:hypothetical protein
VPPASPENLDPNQALVFWLSGGTYCDFRGLSANPKKPFTPPAGPDESRKRFMEVTPDAVRDRDTGVIDGRYRDAWGTPLAVFASDDVGKYQPAATCYGVAPYYTPYRGWLNAGGCQVVSAGPDRKFGPGGLWTPGAGEWGGGKPGHDDLANFRSLQLGAPEGD